MKEKYFLIQYIFTWFMWEGSLYGLPHRFIDNEQDFNTMLIYNAQKPMFVLFSASWCSICTTFKETFAKLTENQLFKDTVMFVTVDFDKAKKLCSHYTVDRIPTFLYFQDARVIRKDIGIKRGVDIKQYFEKTLTETFKLDNGTQKIASTNPSSLKSAIAYFTVPPLRYIKNGIEWCLKKLAT
ncbi:MAG TPA: thioredoxin family protein [Patescibacteria group bacterium]|jgi:thioredoxin-like negative regulator of GroEL|nr:thioredoxin family protein [Patescibacteria group bacterium]